jgi:hypothetical protein
MRQLQLLNSYYSWDTVKKIVLFLKLIASDISVLTPEIRYTYREILLEEKSKTSDKETTLRR